MHPDIAFHLRSFTRFLYVVTEEEDRFLLKLQEYMAKRERSITVFNPVLGLVPLSQMVKDWTSKAHAENSDCPDIHRSLIKMYQEDPRGKQNCYVILDPERYLPDPQVQRRVLQLAHQLHNDERTVKYVIFVGQRLYVPAKLQRYIEVVHDKGLTEDEVIKEVGGICGKLNISVPENVNKVFKGLTSYEIDASIAQSVIKTKTEDVSSIRVDPAVISDFRRRQLQKTDLLSCVEVSGDAFSNIGGIGRYKEWVRKAKSSWTEEGQRFGLVPPKGVLAVGIWGCGKSVAVKATGNAWGLPVVQLEMGKLRSSGVGESEANVYRAIHLIESVAPVLVWVDEAEKSLSGGQSSAQSDAGTTSRTIGILSTWLQETKSHVCLAMTANSLKTLPVEFVNRMDERFFFDMPSKEERVEILKIHLKAKGQDPLRFDLALLAEFSKNMVGREIQQAIIAAMIDSFDKGKPNLDPDLLGDELRRKPRIFKTMVDELKELTDWVGWDPDAQDGIRAKFASSRKTESRQLKVQ